MIGRLRRELLDPRTYGRIGYLLLAGVLGTVEFVFLVTSIALGVGLAVTLIGIPILIGTVYACAARDLLSAAVPQGGAG